MSEKWDQAQIEEYIKRQESEGLQLEYKGADALGTNNDKRDEITKDVSALANSAGGIVIFGISTFKDRKNLPEKLSPVDTSQFSVEWLGQKFGLIQPRIEGIAIHPVQLDSHPNHVAYVVEIPQSTTAHQATDLHYYKRYDARSIPMQDYEIRDVMGRSKHPTLSLNFELHVASPMVPIENRETSDSTQVSPTRVVLQVEATNIGMIYPKYVHTWIIVPETILDKSKESADNGKLRRTNINRDVIQYYASSGNKSPVYGAGRYEPILPGTGILWRIELDPSSFPDGLRNAKLSWTMYADNAPKSEGELIIGQVSTIYDRVNS